MNFSIQINCIHNIPTTAGVSGKTNAVAFGDMHEVGDGGSGGSGDLMSATEGMGTAAAEPEPAASA